MRYLFLTLLFIATPVYAADIINHAGLSDNIVSCWNMDEASGTRVDSVTASGNDLTDTNTVGSGTAHLGTNAADFEVSNGDETLEITDGDHGGSLDMDGDWTIAGWVNTEGGAAGNNIMTGTWSSTGSQRSFYTALQGGGSNTITSMRSCTRPSTTR